jgi:hypothetical protein
LRHSSGGRTFSHAFPMFKVLPQHQGLVLPPSAFDMLYISYMRYQGQLPFNIIAENQKMRTHLIFRGVNHRS